MHNSKIKKALTYLTNYFLPILFWLSVLFGFDTPVIAILTVITAVIHELGHICAMMLIGSDEAVPKGHITGFRLKRPVKSSYHKEILTLAAGPLFNLAAALLALPTVVFFGEYGWLFISLNAMTALSNLIPAEGYDGYGILTLIAEYSGRSTLPLLRISFFMSIFFTFLSLYLIGRVGGGFWIFCIFFVSVITKIGKILKYNVF
ncbi:MAG: hypothetical protein IJW48_03840 [Clostridia bacterium]|nr:hypothetical protein [Clostridia bacterium]